MNSSGLLGWTPGQPTAVIDLGEEFAPDPSNASSAALQFSAAYYSIDSSVDQNGSKKRKVERACDFCRRRKARCDGPRMPDNVCSNCIANSRTCTYIEGSKPRGPPKAYVVGLEDRVEKMEALLKRLRPEADFSSELGPPVIRDSWKTDTTHPASSSDKARSNSPHTAEGSPSASKPSSVALMAPPPNRACPSTPSAKPSADPKSRPIAGRKVSKSSRALRPSEQEPSSNSDQDPSSSSPSDSSDTDEAGELSIVRGLKRLTLRGLEPAEALPDKYENDSQMRFHGKSSSFKLISTTRDLIQKHILENVSNSSDGGQGNSPDSIQLSSSTTGAKRPEFWTVPPWEKAYEHADDPTVLPEFLLPAFPPPDLAETLIHDYFQYNNNTFPLLHRPTFERQWRDQLYTRNVWFACVCMAIFGLASRWSSDPRVLPDDVADKATTGDEEGIWRLAGWKFIAIGTQLHEARRSVLLPPELFEIQSFALIGQYFRGTVAQQGSWFYLSVGVIKAQDVGAHRRKIYGRKVTIEEELWKRAYWHLVAFDRIGSMLIGRECCTREEDLDLEMPLEVDDEYWETEDPELAFRQPAGKPSIVTGFVCWIKLSHIVAFTLKTLYAHHRSDSSRTASNHQLKEEIVEKLNEALNKWLDELPLHLRWRPDMEDRRFASQAATLYTTYQLVQILIYRPFIHVPRGMNATRPLSLRRRELSQNALAICLCSARSAAHILDVQIGRGMLNITNVVHVSFICAGVLLIHLWDLIRQYGLYRRLPPSEARAQVAQEISSVMSEIGDLMARLEEVSPKWELAREMLDELKETLPNSPTDDTPPQETLADAEPFIPAHYSASSSRTSQEPTPGYTQHHSSIAPERGEVSGYQEYPDVRPAPHAPQPHFAGTAPIPLQLSFEGGLPQLWDMDGAPASPPPLPAFSMFMPPQQPQQPQQPLPRRQYAPAPVHKPPGPAPTYSHPSHSIPGAPPHLAVHPVEHPHRNDHPEMRPPQPARGWPPYYEPPNQPMHGPEPGHLPEEYRPSFLKQEELPFDERECLRLRLLEEAFRQRQTGPQRGAPGNAAPFGGPSSAGRHPPEQWVNRWS